MLTERIASIYLENLHKTALTPVEEILASVRKLSKTSYQIEISTYLPLANAFRWARSVGSEYDSESPSFSLTPENWMNLLQDLHEMQDQAGIAILALKRSVPPLQKAAEQVKRALGGNWVSKTTVSTDGHFVMSYQSIYKGPLNQRGIMDVFESIPEIEEISSVF